ncbi:uncharacterized protein LOC142338698 [Convolutriloba macropyga]|uniref:uncharacterized protein LOC142338698 n=1 Tax=Convolutriloba macropyga TaxID=536237 RepID=UPI003F51F988
MNSNLGGNHKCDKCANETTELFHCETCDRSREDNQSEKEFLCDVCVGSHLQRGHIITDMKGYEPLVCPEHKMLQQEYCRTCDFTFCSKCTQKHSKHEFDTLEKRGSELRGQVFELLAELELGEKPLRLKKEEMSDIIESHKKEQLMLFQHLEKEIEKLRQSCSEIVEENCKTLSTGFRQLSESVEQTVDLQRQFRDLLASSNARLLKDFSTRKKDYELNKSERCEKMEKRGQPLMGCATSTITQNFKNFTQKLRSDLKLVSSIKEGSKMPKRVEAMNSNCLESNEFYLQDWGSHQCLKVSAGNGQLCVQLVACRSSRLVVSNDMKRVTEFQGNIDICFAFSKRRRELFEESILLLLVGTSAYTFNLTKKELKMNKITPILYKYVLCPYCDARDSIHWCYWDEETKLIKFTHDEMFTIKCDALPKVKRNDKYSVCSLMLITADNNVIVADAHEKKYWIIEVRNKIKTINSTTLHPSGIVLLWCREDESVFMTIMKDNKFKPLAKCKWNTKSLFTNIEVDLYKLKIIPGVRNSSGEYDPYLFMVKW